VIIITGLFALYLRKNFYSAENDGKTFVSNKEIKNFTVKKGSLFSELLTG
jgi:hypothetical protein